MINERPEEVSGLYDGEEWLAIAVEARVKTDGEILPLSFMWEGRRLIIEKILDKQPARNRKLLRSGLRYLVCIEGRPYSLFVDRGYWYLDLKNLNT